MSKYFQVGDQTLWNPANVVADLFVRTADALVLPAGSPTGIGPLVGDDYEVDPDEFCRFVDPLVRRYIASNHPILRALLEGFTATALVLVDRVGRSVPAASDWKFIDGPVALVAPENAARLGRLSEEFANSMGR